MSDHKFSGMVMDGPKKGTRVAMDRSHFKTVTLPKINSIADLDDPDKQELFTTTYDYVWSDGGDGKLPGWWLQ